MTNIVKLFLKKTALCFRNVLFFLRSRIERNYSLRQNFREEEKSE